MHLVSMACGLGWRHWFLWAASYFKGNRGRSQGNGGCRGVWHGAHLSFNAFVVSRAYQIREMVQSTNLPGENHFKLKPLPPSISRDTVILTQSGILNRKLYLDFGLYEHGFHCFGNQNYGDKSILSLKQLFDRCTLWHLENRYKIGRGKAGTRLKKTQ